MNGESALGFIDYLEKRAITVLEYARLKVAGRTRVIFIPAPSWMCSFNGYLLASVVDRKTEFAILLQDADDWGEELVVDSLEKAERLFDEVFNPPDDNGDGYEYDEKLRERLRNYGFGPI